MLRRMSLRWRLTLALAGLVFVAFACAALVYSLRPPADHNRERIPVTPTLFSPPQSFHNLAEVE